MKVYITKYWETQGIYSVDVGVEVNTPTMVSVKGVKWSQYFHKPDWHETWEEAVEHAEQMRQKKITSLEKKLAKLKKLRFNNSETK